MFPKFAVAGQVENIVARQPGTGGSQTILLLSHYDSVHSGPGANDGGSAVATLMETARALKPSSPLMNDVIFLFTDGEEVGLIGAAGIARQNPWMKDVGLVLNFEGGGNAGPVILFETSPENAWLIGEVAKEARYPATISFSYEVYRNLPNDTDFTVFKNAGVPGFTYQPRPAWTMMDRRTVSDSVLVSASYTIDAKWQIGDMHSRSERASPISSKKSPAISGGAF